MLSGTGSECSPLSGERLPRKGMLVPVRLQTLAPLFSSAGQLTATAGVKCTDEDSLAPSINVNSLKRLQNLLCGMHRSLLYPRQEAGYEQVQGFAAC